MRVMKKLAALAVAVVAVVGLAGVTTAAPASAATGKNGVVESGEFGLYYLTGSSGLVFDLFVSDSNFSDDVFPGTSISADNNTESYQNRDSGQDQEPGSRVCHTPTGTAVAHLPEPRPATVTQQPEPR